LISGGWEVQACIPPGDVRNFPSDVGNFLARLMRQKKLPFVEVRLKRLKSTEVFQPVVQSLSG